MFNVQSATTLRSTQRCTLYVARCSLVLVIVLLSSCSQKPGSVTKTFYDIDSLVSVEINSLKTSGHGLKKSVEIDGKKEQTTFVPDSLEWVHELDVFRQLDQINKASFRDAYVVTDTRDTNSNLSVREIKANRPVPVSLVRFYYLRTPKDLRKIEATWTEENTLYLNNRRMTMEMDDKHVVNHYRIEGIQKMVMNDSVRFVIVGDVGIN